MSKKDRLGVTMNHYDRVCAYVDLDAINQNILNMKSHIQESTSIMCVIKADGYGHGAIPIAKEVESNPAIFGFATATAEEALALRHVGIKKPILILGYTFPYSFSSLIEQDIILTVFKQETLLQLVTVAKTLKKKAFIHIKMDTAMSRIGRKPDDETIAFIKEAMSYEELVVDGIFTHFAKADELDKNAAYQQLERFEQFVERVKKECPKTIPHIHSSNSAALLEIPKANMNFVRAGISLYGLWPSNEVAKDCVSLIPALTLKSQIIFIKKIEKGTSVSYGGTFTAEKDMKIATVPIGYGDGYPRSLSNKGYVVIRGKKAPIIGRVCMDQFMVDITDFEKVEEQDEVILIGKSGALELTMEELGDLSGRFNYELACDLGKRIPRAYLKSGKIVATKDYYHDYE